MEEVSSQTLTDYDELKELEEDYEQERRRLGSSISEWLHKIRYNPADFWSKYQAVKEDECLKEIERGIWRSYGKERYKKRVVYVGSEYQSNNEGEFTPGYDAYTTDMSLEFKLSAEDVYIETVRKQKLQDLFNQVWRVCSITDRKVLQALSIFIPQYCASNCSNLGKCDIPSFDTSCKRHLKGNRWIRNNEAARILKYDKSAVTQVLKRLKKRVIANLSIDPDDMIFLFS